MVILGGTVEIYATSLLSCTKGNPFKGSTRSAPLAKLEMATPYGSPAIGRRRRKRFGPVAPPLGVIPERIDDSIVPIRDLRTGAVVAGAIATAVTIGGITYHYLTQERDEIQPLPRYPFVPTSDPDWIEAKWRKEFGDELPRRHPSHFKFEEHEWFPLLHDGPGSDPGSEDGRRTKAKKAKIFRGGSTKTYFAPRRWRRSPTRGPKIATSGRDQVSIPGFLEHHPSGRQPKRLAGPHRTCRR